MDLDDLPRKPAPVTVGDSLDHLSVTELEHRIQALESEIARVRAVLGSKQASKTAADAFFKR